MTNLKELTDEEVVRLVCSENQEYYKEIVERYQEKLLRYAGYLLGDPNNAQDPVQEAFIKAFINLRSFNQDLKFSSWIYRIVHNETMNQIKKSKRTQRLDPSHDRGEITQLRDNDREEITDLIKRSLATIPFKYRAPLVLFFLENKTYKEISDVLRIPIGTVGTRINRGKKIVKEILERKEAQVYA